MKYTFRLSQRDSQLQRWIRNYGCVLQEEVNAVNQHQIFGAVSPLSLGIKGQK